MASLFVTLSSAIIIQVDGTMMILIENIVVELLFLLL